MEPGADHKHVPWIAILLLVSALAVFFLSGSSRNTLSITASSPSTAPLIPKAAQSLFGSESSGAAPAQSMTIAPDRYYGGEVAATDTREFLKTDYNAQMKTRDVQGLVRRAETTIRGSGGRVDQTSSSPKSGYVGFVIPASKFEAFRDEIESLVGPRYLTVSINSQNLLPQKQNIEEQQKSVEEQLADLKSERSSLVSAHTNTIKSLQARRNTISREIADLNLEASATSWDSPRYPQIFNEIDQLSAEDANISYQISAENSSYRNNLDSLDAQIDHVETNLEAVKTQDQDLLDTVATVRGTITFTWISVWQIIQLYVPAGWIAAIIALLAVLAWWWERRPFSHHTAL